MVYRVGNLLLKHKLDCTQHEQGQLEDALANQVKLEARMEAAPAKAFVSWRLCLFWQQASDCQSLPALCNVCIASLHAACWVCNETIGPIVNLLLPAECICYNAVLMDSCVARECVASTYMDQGKT